MIVNERASAPARRFCSTLTSCSVPRVWHTMRDGAEALRRSPRRGLLRCSWGLLAAACIARTGLANAIINQIDGQVVPGDLSLQSCLDKSASPSASNPAPACYCTSIRHAACTTTRKCTNKIPKRP